MGKSQSEARKAKREAIKRQLPSANQRIWMQEMAEAERRGRTQARADAMTFLEQRYMDDALDMQSPKGLAIFELAKELSRHLTEQEVKDSKPASGPATTRARTREEQV